MDHVAAHVGASPMMVCVCVFAVEGIMDHAAAHVGASPMMVCVCVCVFAVEGIMDHVAAHVGASSIMVCVLYVCVSKRPAMGEICHVRCIHGTLLYKMSCQ